MLNETLLWWDESAAQCDLLVFLEESTCCMENVRWMILVSFKDELVPSIPNGPSKQSPVFQLNDRVG